MTHTEGGEVDYKKLYILLFNACTDAVRHIDDKDYAAARDALVLAQQRTEELYIAKDETE